MSEHFVIDAVAHATDFSENNRPADTPAESHEYQNRWLYRMFHEALESQEPGYMLSFEEFISAYSAEALASIFFEESDVDMIAYHAVDITGLAKYGPSPWKVGVEMKRLYPDRVLLYAPADPFAGPAGLEAMEERVAQAPVDGFKFYPSNGLLDPSGKAVNPFFFDDPEVAFPYLEKARELGVGIVAIHKAIPVGPGRLDKDHVEDISAAAVAFPDLTFEVVHSGWAFLEECAMQLALHSNVWANLETVSNFAVRAPRRFARALGTLIEFGGSDRIVHASGGAISHPGPALRAVEAVEMPEDLLEEGLPELTDEIKRKILGTNMAALHGIDIEERRVMLADDEWSRLRAAYPDSGHGPWYRHRAEIAEREGVAA